MTGKSDPDASDPFSGSSFSRPSPLSREEWDALDSAAKEAALNTIRKSIFDFVQEIKSTIETIAKRYRHTQARHLFYKRALIFLTMTIALVNLANVFFLEQSEHFPVPQGTSALLNVSASVLAILVSTLGNYDSFRGYSAEGRRLQSFEHSLKDVREKYEIAWAAYVVPGAPNAFQSYLNAVSLADAFAVDLRIARTAWLASGAQEAPDKKD